MSFASQSCLLGTCRVGVGDILCEFGVWLIAVLVDLGMDALGGLDGLVRQGLTVVVVWARVR